MKKTIIIFISIIFIFLIHFENKKIKKPTLTLKGKNIITLSKGEKYIEPGYNSNSKVKVTGKIDTNKEGIYELIYTAPVSKKEKIIKKRFIQIKEDKRNLYKSEYDNIDNTSRGWWSGNKFDHQRPSGGANINELKKYNAFFLGPDEKVIYLTFDEGSYETYVKEIVDVLNKNNIKATFFFCKNYIIKNQDLIKQMNKDGHSIGNHTYHHLNMPSLATKENFEKYLEEIKSVEDVFKQITGKEIDKVYRDPRGEWSYRDLQIMKDLGYKTYFYSANHNDFSGTLSKEQTLSELMKRYHNGAIYLLHPNNKGNYEALEPFILEMKKQGYKFDLVKNIRN